MSDEVKVNKDYNYEEEPQGAESFWELKIDNRTRRFLAAIKDLSRPKILEIGMGQGRFLKKIIGLRSDLVLFGLDISQAAIESAKKDYRLEGTFVVGDAEKVPFPADFFEAVVIMDVLEHVKNPEKVISEAKRILKPGGVFHFYIPCEAQPFTLDQFLRKTNFLNLRDFTKINFGHIQFFSQQDVKNLVNMYFSQATATYSVHWASQLFHFLTLYLPKELISLLGKNIKNKTRDSYKPEVQGKAVLNSLIILKNIWLLFIFPISIIYEIEACLFKHFYFAAKGLHFTCQKKYE